MNVSIKNKENLEALMQVDIEAGDYQEQVNKILKDYRRRADIPGFRKGHVPMGLIKKQYGTAVLIDEINKILEKAITTHLKESDFEIIGSPLPKEQNNIDWKEQSDFSFEFELGIKPDFDLELNKKLKVPYYSIKADKNYLDKHVIELQENYGSMEQEDEVGEKSVITGLFTEVDDKGGELPEGLQTEGNLAMRAISTKKIKKALMGKKAGETQVIDLDNDLEKEYSKSQILKAEEEQLQKAGHHFLITIEEIHRKIPAELNQEFFDKIVGEGVVSSEEELRENLKETIEESLVKESEQKFLYDMQEHLITKTKMELPEEFLKKWLKTEKKELTDEQLENDFDDFLKGFKWQLIEERIIKDHELQVTRDDLEEHVMGMLKGRAQMQEFEPDAEVVQSLMNSLMQNEEQVRSLSQNIMESKIKDQVKELIKVDNKDLTFDEFVKKVSK